jgi:hypothetical protein
VGFEPRKKTSKLRNGAVVVGMIGSGIGTRFGSTRAGFGYRRESKHSFAFSNFFNLKLNMDVNASNSSVSGLASVVCLSCKERKQKCDKLFAQLLSL